jgi:hypothetical protein
MMTHRTIGIFAWALFVVFCPLLHACIWDYDTLAMERQRFPHALELITGKFLRHSAAFYEWRVQDREKAACPGPVRSRALR